MKKLIDNISKVNSDLEYLKDEYSRIKLYGSRDGDVEFASLIEWISENEHTVEHMISLVKNIKKIK